MAQLFKNNATSYIDGAISSTATSIDLSSGTGAKFPTITGSDYFLATIVGLNSGGVEDTWEIVKVTGRSSDTLTVVRAQESTTALSWAHASRIENRLTAASTNDFTSGGSALQVDSGTGAVTIPGTLGVTGATTFGNNVNISSASYGYQIAGTSVLGYSGGNVVVGDLGAGVVLEYGGGAKLNTTSTGVDVTGTTTSNGPLIVNPDTAGKNTFRLTSNAVNDASLLMNSNTTLKVSIQANASSYFNGGNVGIGTAVPSASLDVVTNTDVWTGEFTQSNTSNGDGVLVNVGSTAAADYALSVRTNAGSYPAFNVKADGNVGIGIFSPLDILHLNDPNDDCVLNLDTAIANKNSMIKFSDPDAQGRGFIQYAHIDGSFRITVEGSERLRIASAGQIGIGGANYGTDGQVLTSTGASSAPAWEDAGGGGGAYSGWLVKTTTFTASSGDQLIAKHATTAFTITLPASPSEGDSVTLKNVGAALLTVGRNSQNIDSAAEDATMPTGNAAQLVYVDSTIGWTVI